MDAPMHTSTIAMHFNTDTIYSSLLGACDDSALFVHSPRAQLLASRVVVAYNLSLVADKHSDWWARGSHK